MCACIEGTEVCTLQSWPPACLRQKRSGLNMKRGRPLLLGVAHGVSLGHSPSCPGAPGCPPRGWDAPGCCGTSLSSWHICSKARNGCGLRSFVHIKCCHLAPGSLPSAVLSRVRLRHPGRLASAALNRKTQL